MISDKIFQATGAVFIAGVGMIVACVVFVVALLLLKELVVHVWIARLYRPALKPAVDCKVLRVLHRLWFGVSMMWNGVPDSEVTYDGRVMWDKCWLDGPVETEDDDRPRGHDDV